VAARRPGRAVDRWVVLDVEATGLDVASDRLVALAGVALVGVASRTAPCIDIADSFEAVVRLPDPLPPPSRDAILVHGIGVGAQRAGLEPADALAAFARWAGEAPLLGFHVAFDRALVERAERAAGVVPPRRLWVDLEPLAALAAPDAEARSLDAWLARFGIVCLRRHDAAADALATAELLLALWPRLGRLADARDAGALARLAAQRRWLIG
jgi:DNA polymerase-3 subunit epsilon